ASRASLGLGLLGRRRPPEAEAEYRAALAVQEALAADFPTVPEYRVELGATYVNLGHQLRDRGDAAAALDWHGKAIDRPGPIVAAERPPAQARLFLRNAHAGRAMDSTQLNRFAEALADWD